MKIIRGHKSHHNILIIFNTYKNDYIINFNLNNYIILKLNSELRFLELVLKRGFNFTKKTLELILLMVFTLYNN